MILRTFVATIAGVVSALGLSSTVPRPAPLQLATPIQLAPLDDLKRAQRRVAWDLVVRLTRTIPDAEALLRTWHSVEEAFASPQGTDDKHMHAALTQSGEPQVIIFTLFNEPAFRHIRQNDLQNESELVRLQAAGDPDPRFPHNRRVPPLPDGAVVLLTAWWPIARDRITAMPVWDPELNPPLAAGNNYITWQRSVAVDPLAHESSPPVASIEFAGRRFPEARRVALRSFQTIPVDRYLAEQVARDPLSRKAAVIALGRPLAPGDSLALVALHTAAKERGKWVWATLWWHDQPEKGPYAEARPEVLRGAWRNYLLDAPLDPETAPAQRLASDICFNPWFEARFPDQGAGGGTSSNCVSCHQRASYPAASFLPVTRGTVDIVNDEAFAPGRVRTDMLWSLARRSTAGSGKSAAH